MKKNQEKKPKKELNQKQNHKITVKLDYNKKIIEKDGGARIYRDCVLLTPGAWSDSTGMSAIEYTETELRRAAGNWSSNFLNLDHRWDVLSRIGHVENTHWNDGVRGDLYIYPITQNARDAISLIDADMINELSVELMSRDVWKSEDEKRYATDIEFVGTAVVVMGACRETRIK